MLRIYNYKKTNKKEKKGRREDGKEKERKAGKMF